MDSYEKQTASNGIWKKVKISEKVKSLYLPGINYDFIHSFGFNGISTDLELFYA